MPPISLVWDKNNLAHLWQSHQVTPDEVQEALLGVDGEESRFMMRRDGDYYRLLAETADGRLLSMIGEFLDSGTLYVFSARDMNSSEKRRFRSR